MAPNPAAARTRTAPWAWAAGWALLLSMMTLCACRGEGPPPPAEPAPPQRSAAPLDSPTDGAPGCTLEHIRAVVSPRLPAVTACYRAAAQADPRVGGRLAVELGIERDGRLLRRSVHESDLPMEVNACVVAALDGLRFPGRFDAPCVVVYPFVFSAGPPGSGK